MDFKKYLEMYENLPEDEKGNKLLHGDWKPEMGDNYIEKGYDCSQVINSEDDLKKIKTNKDKYGWLLRAKDFYRPELLLRGSVLNEDHLNKLMNGYWKAKNDKKIKPLEGDVHTDNLQMAMYIFYFQEWDDEKKEWINTTYDILSSYIKKND